MGGVSLTRRPARLNDAVDHVFITTDRLRLRHPRPDDAEAIAALFDDPKVTEFLGGPRVHDEVAKIVLDDAAADPNPADLWPLEELETENVVGYCGLVVKEVDGVEEHEVIYVLAPHVWGRGYASEIAAAIVDYAFTERRLDRVISMIHPDNAASARVAERAGMAYERDTIRPGGKRLRVFALPRSGADA